MILLGIRKVQDVDGVPYEVADVKREDALLGFSVRLDTIFGSDENLRTWLLSVPEDKIDEYLCEIIEQTEAEAIQAEVKNDDAWLGDNSTLAPVGDSLSHLNRCAHFDDGCELSPIISGGEVLDRSNYKSNIDEDNLPY